MGGRISVCQTKNPGMIVQEYNWKTINKKGQNKKLNAVVQTIVSKLDFIQLLSLDKQVKLCQSHCVLPARGAVVVGDNMFNWLHLSTVAMCR